MSELIPEPQTPYDCDLTDFQFMPLDVLRLRDSELASNESPASCWAAVLLWCASWHQIPAGSMPDDDKWIAKQAGYAARGKIDREWSKVRDGALRGWIKCSDGRLYHPVVTEKALDAWKAKTEQRYRSECARVKKHNQRHTTNISVPEYEQWLSMGRPTGHPLHVPGDNDKKEGDSAGDKNSKRQGEGQGQGDSNSVPDGTGGKPPQKSPEEMTKAELWSAGKSLLRAGKMPEAQCGTFVGQLVKNYGDDIVIEAVRGAVLTQPADAPSYLKATCQRLAGERKPTNRQKALESKNRDVAARLAAGEPA